MGSDAVSGLADRELPEGFVLAMNALGLALMLDEGDQRSRYRFERTGLGGDVHVVLTPVEQLWRVGVHWRAVNPLPGKPAPLTPVSLAGLGSSTDGETIDVSNSDLLEKLPSLLGRCVLPVLDFAPTGE